MKILILAAAFVCGSALAAPFIMSDPSTDSPAPTSCTCTVDGVTLPASPTVGGACKVDIGSLAAGVHVASCKFSSTDPKWPAPSAASAPPFSFSLSGALTPPQNLRLIAN